MYFYATPKRCECLKIGIKNNKTTPPFDLSTIKYVSGGTSGNTKLMGTDLKNFYNYVKTVIIIFRKCH